MKSSRFPVAFAGFAGVAMLAFAALLEFGAHAQQSVFPLESAVTGTEYIANAANPTGVFFTAKQLAQYASGINAGVNAQTGTSYTFAASDCGKLVTFSNTGATAVTLPAATAAAFGAGCVIQAENLNSGAVTITPTTSTINGAATLVLNQNRGSVIMSDGTNYQVQLGAAGLQATPAVVPEGGTGAATFTNHGLMLGSGTAALAVTPVGTTGQLLQGVSGANPAWATTLSGTYTFSGANTYSGVSTFSGQIVSTAGLPTIASGACGATTNGAVVAGSTNQSGNITIGSATTTTCTVSFSATLGTAPNACVIFPTNATAAATGTTVARVSSITTAAFVVTGSALTNANYEYICL